MTIRLPDDKRRRPKDLARQRATTVNRLIDEMTTAMLTEADAETRFHLRASRGAGRTAEGLALIAAARGDDTPQG